MNMPKYIDYALTQRAKLASKLMDYCGIIDDWLEAHNVEAPSEDCFGGVEIYTNPYASEMSVRAAIKDA